MRQNGMGAYPAFALYGKLCREWTEKRRTIQILNFARIFKNPVAATKFPVVVPVIPVAALVFPVVALGRRGTALMKKCSGPAHRTTPRKQAERTLTEAEKAASIWPIPKKVQFSLLPFPSTGKNSLGTAREPSATEADKATAEAETGVEAKAENNTHLHPYTSPFPPKGRKSSFYFLFRKRTKISKK